MSQLHVYRPDLADESPPILSFVFYAPLIRAERAMAALREARQKRESLLKFKDDQAKPISLRVFDGRFGR